MTTRKSSPSRDPKGFDLQLPGSFSLCPELALENEAAQDLEKIVLSAAEVLTQYPVVGLILTGSVARGEGTLVPDRELGSRWLSDIEFQVVLDGNRRVNIGEVDVALATLQRTINTEPRNISRGISVSFTCILAGQIARLRPAIFSREMLEHGKLVWGRPERVPVPLWWREGENEIPQLDAFRLLSNRIIQQLDTRFRWQYIDRNSIRSAYILSKFWIELTTSLSVFIGCYRTSYRERQQAVEDYLKKDCEILGTAREMLINRLKRSMLVKAGRATPAPCSADDFRESAQVAALVWKFEVQKMLGHSRPSLDASAPGVIVSVLRRLEPYAQRTRDWARLLRRNSTHADFRGELLSALRAGSLANAIYASGCLLHFFWDEFAPDSGLGLNLCRTVRKLLNTTQLEQVDQRLILSQATVAAWERHLHFAAR
jgi:hypothetical protein